VVGPPKLMLVLKVPVQLVLGWAAVRFPGLATGVQVCASAGPDMAKEKSRADAGRHAPHGLPP
jgi:hypothetical protein